MGVIASPIGVTNVFVRTALRKGSPQDRLQKLFTIWRPTRINTAFRIVPQNHTFLRFRPLDDLKGDILRRELVGESGYSFGGHPPG
jgi:hypothetical protein